MDKQASAFLEIEREDRPMSPQQLLQLLRQRPFKPFRVSLNDGRVFDIRYPDLNIVGMTWFLMMLFRKPKSMYCSVWTMFGM